MAVSPERKGLPTDVDVRPEEFPEIPIEVENKTVVTPTPSQFKAQVFDDKGKPMIQSSGSDAPTITLPADTAQLTAFSKGSPDDALTWFGAFFKRIFKKAVHFGLRVVTKGGS